MFPLEPVRPMAKTLRVLAAVLGYPDARMRPHLPQMRELLRLEQALAAARLDELDALMGTLQRADALEAEAAYVELFDRGRATSLHLFEHVHGDSRDRGPALIDLGQTYEKAGLVLAEGELPDYLPVVLEFVSTQPPREARAFLGEMVHILQAVFGALQQRDSAYASVLGALIELAGEKALAVVPPAEAPLDESWAEPVVFDGCSTVGQSKPDQAGPGQAQPIRIIRNNTQPGASA
ncbi:MAG TPA: nitrate reductase molybdenum cofactor assembly chaperone [Burkholderiales bacterium]